jgi:hypothetical protein
MNIFPTEYFTNKKLKPSKMCIFDIDNTLTFANNANEEACGVSFDDSGPPPQWPDPSGTTDVVKQAISDCLKNDYGIAIATAETGNQAESNIEFIKSLNPYLDDAWIRSPNFQHSCTIGDKKLCKDVPYSDKTAMLLNIMNYNNIPPEEWENSVFFDDAMSNLSTASTFSEVSDDGTDLKTCQASPNCGGEYCDTGCGLPRGCLNLI